MTLNKHLIPRALRYLEVVAQVGSIQGASRELGISASAIDRQILVLENLIDLKLFERDASGMTPTDVGQMFVVLAQRWRRDVDGLWSEIQQRQGRETGHLRIAVMDSQVNGVLPVFAARVAEQHPGMTLDLEVSSTEDAIKALDQGTVDMALAFNLKPDRNIKLIWSTELPMGCVVCPGHELARKAEIRLQEIAAYPVVIQNRTLEIRKYFEARHEWFLYEGTQPLTTNSLQLLKHMAALGKHVVLTSELDAAPEIIDGRLVFVPIADKAVRPQSIGVAVSSRRTTQTVVDLIGDLLSSCVRTMLTQARDAHARLKKELPPGRPDLPE
ncbi:MAG: LysR family transcriptional regulator [Hyphomicrobiales bacterium]|nr:LysR family transcriptional regulator [Hyphomicrobiales bacterium]